MWTHITGQNRTHTQVAFIIWKNIRRPILNLVRMSVWMGKKAMEHIHVCVCRCVYCVLCYVCIFVHVVLLHPFYLSNREYGSCKCVVNCYRSTIPITYNVFNEHVLTATDTQAHCLRPIRKKIKKTTQWNSLISLENSWISSENFFPFFPSAFRSFAPPVNISRIIKKTLAQINPFFFRKKVFSRLGN